MDAIARTKVDMQVYVANYVVPGDDAAYQRQKLAMGQALQTFGVDHVAGM